MEKQQDISGWESVDLDQAKPIEYWSDEAQTIRNHKTFAAVIDCDITTPLFRLLVEVIAKDTKSHVSRVYQVVKWQMRNEQPDQLLGYQD